MKPQSSTETKAQLLYRSTFMNLQEKKTNIKDKLTKTTQKYKPDREIITMKGCQQ